MTKLITMAIALALGAALFWTIERLWPAVRDQNRLRTGRRTDIAYYFLNGTITKLASGIFVAVVAIVAARAIGISITVDQMRGIAERDTFVARQPLLLQALELIVIADFIGYWMHRTFHFQPTLWRYHAVHHSSRQVDWLASVRVHPLNDVVTNTAQALPLLLLGFSGATLGGYAVLLAISPYCCTRTYRGRGARSSASSRARSSIAGTTRRRSRASIRTLPACCRSGIWSSVPTTCRRASSRWSSASRARRSRTASGASCCIRCARARH